MSKPAAHLTSARLKHRVWNFCDRVVDSDGRHVLVFYIRNRLRRKNPQSIPLTALDEISNTILNRVERESRGYIFWPPTWWGQMARRLFGWMDI